MKRECMYACTDYDLLIMYKCVKFCDINIHSYVNLNWSHSPETVKLSCDLCDLDLWPLTLTFCMNLTLVIGNNSWKFHDDTMIGT